ncbi:hypothetical protein POG22_23260 [Geitlerinema sp. CS-897]|nr:hypothetical protein [Geitlerinema sp. CS-897]
MNPTIKMMSSGNKNQRSLVLVARTSVRDVPSAYSDRDWFNGETTRRTRWR